MLTLASKFTAPHSIGSSASLSASALVGGGGGGCVCGPGWRPRWWRVEGLITAAGQGTAASGAGAECAVVTLEDGGGGEEDA